MKKVAGVQNFSSFKLLGAGKGRGSDGGLENNKNCSGIRTTLPYFYGIDKTLTSFENHS